MGQIGAPLREHVTRLLGALLLLTAHDAPAAPAAVPDSAIEFELLEEKLSNGEIKVFNGTIVVASDWNGIVVAKVPAGSDLISCSAVLVGLRVLLTAAHCVDAGTAIARPVRIKVGDEHLQFQCRMDASYTGAIRMSGFEPPDPDYALCVLPENAPAPPRFRNLTREWIDLAPPGAVPVLLTGYGCQAMTVNLSAPSLEFGPFDEKRFTIGDEKLEPATDAETKLFTISAQAREPALCRSDSGGPLFSGVTTTSIPDGNRSVRGINSWVSVDTGQLVSRYASLSSESFLRFLACWRMDHPQAQIQLRNAQRIPSCDG